jgi:SAM-dependent methyltransferase
LGSAVRQQLDDREIEYYVWSDELVRFYEQTDAFLFESLVWNVTRHKNGIRRWVAEFLRRSFEAPATVLTYGDGLGIDSYYLRQAGHRVTSFEVSQRCVEFARSICDADAMDVQIVRDAGQLPSGQFDAVLCLDVLEHVPDPPALVQQLSHTLRAGGYLIVHAPFFFVDPAVVTHLQSNRRFSGDIRRLYRPAGLRLVDGRPFWDPLVLQKADHGAPWPPGSRSRARRLHTTGLLLAVARYWAAPHCLMARYLTRARVARLTGEVNDE